MTPEQQNIIDTYVDRYEDDLYDECNVFDLIDEIVSLRKALEPGTFAIQLLRRYGVTKTAPPPTHLELAQARIFDLLLPDDGHAQKEAERYLEQHRPDLHARLKAEWGKQEAK